MDKTFSMDPQTLQKGKSLTLQNYGALDSQKKTRTSSKTSTKSAGQSRGHGRCEVCRSLLETETDGERDTIERATKVILGLMGHYSNTLLGVLKTDKKGVLTNNFIFF